MDFVSFKKARVFKRGRGGSDAAHQADEKLYHERLVRHKEIQRTTINTDRGIESITIVTTKNPELIKILQEHALGMKKRFDSGRAVRSWDQLFVDLFDNRDKIDIDWEILDDGIKVSLTSEDEKTRELIKLHDETLHAFVNHGFKASRHDSPYREK